MSNWKFHLALLANGGCCSVSEHTFFPGLHNLKGQFFTKVSLKTFYSLINSNFYSILDVHKLKGQILETFFD